MPASDFDKTINNTNLITQWHFIFVAILRVYFIKDKKIVRCNKERSIL